MELEYTLSFQWANYQSITRVRVDLNGALDVFLPKWIAEEGELFPRLVESICTRWASWHSNLYRNRLIDSAWLIHRGIQIHTKFMIIVCSLLNLGNFGAHWLINTKNQIWLLTIMDISCILILYFHNLFLSIWLRQRQIKCLERREKLEGLRFTERRGHKVTLL